MQIERIYKPNTANDNKASKTGTGKKPYEAFDSIGKPSPYTEIRCVLQPSQSPQSRFFMAAVFSADYDDAFTLLYSFMAVEVKGRNLKEVRRAIQIGRCEFIQEYNENEFLKPGKDAPVIESIGFDKVERSPEGTKIEVPLDIVISLLRPDELEKLKNYITSYLMKSDSSEGE